MQTKIAKTVSALYPLFPVLVYFSVLTGHPPVWVSLIIAIIPMATHYWSTHRLILRTPFDIPILIFVLGTLLGFIVAPDKSIAAGALYSTIASILVYYGITTNSGASRKYWLWIGGIICLITLLLSLWFLSQGTHRVLSFNQWAFNLFSGLPKTSGPVLNLNTIGALLAVVIPPLFAFLFFKNNTNLRIIALVLWLFFSGVLFLSDSGAGWLAVAVSLVFIMICWRKWLIWVLAPVGGLLASAAVLFYDKTQWLRISFSTASLMSRVKLWQNTLPLLQGKASVTGLGLGSWFKVYSSNYTGYVPVIVHNSYLQLYCDTGIFGLIAMVLAAIIFIRLSIHLLKLSPRNSVNWIGIGLIGSIIAGAIFAMFDVTTSVTYVTNTGYIYLVLPLLWIGAALLSVVSGKLASTSN
jgi:putative inorganic carbon (HCO3(-)) transporter